MNTYLKTIEPHLLTDDSTVQRSIMHSLQEYPNIPVEWTSELLKKSMESKQADSDIIINLESATFDRNAVVQLIRVLENAKSNVIHIYKGLFHQIEPELLIEFKKQLSPYIPDEEWEFYQFLVDCEDRQEAEHQYYELIDRLEMERFDQNLFDKGKRLIDLFSKRRWLDEWEIENTVKENLEFDYFVYLGIYAVYAMGLSRNPKWIPYLVRLLDREEDILVEEASKALIGYQSDDVIKAVRPLCLSDDFIFPIGVVNDTRTPFAVESLIELYHQVDEDAWDAKELIVEGLCHQFSPKALPIIAEHMENSFATGLVDLEAEVYGTFAVLGAEHEGLNEWKRIAEEREQRFQSTMENDLKSLVNRKPIVTEKKVGRNAPCPCGSGKKYKKCCGN